jgi:hypothetical protein
MRFIAATVGTEGGAGIRADQRRVKSIAALVWDDRPPETAAGPGAGQGRERVHAARKRLPAPDEERDRTQNRVRIGQPIGRSVPLDFAEVDRLDLAAEPGEEFLVPDHSPEVREVLVDIVDHLKTPSGFFTRRTASPGALGTSSAKVAQRGGPTHRGVRPDKARCLVEK